MYKIKVFSGLLALFIVLPIWFYLIYQILSAIEVNELTWFLFWIYVPISMFVTGVGRFLDGDT